MGSTNNYIKYTCTRANRIGSTNNYIEYTCTRASHIGSELSESRAITLSTSEVRITARFILESMTVSQHRLGHA